MMSKKTLGVREISEQIKAEADAIKCDHQLGELPMNRLGELTPLQEPRDFCKSLVKQIRNHPGSMGPFYKRFLAGEVPMEGMKEWIRHFYYDARDFTCIVAQIVANAQFAFEVRQKMSINLMEELGDGRPSKEHPHLIKTIARALGVEGDELEYIDPIPEVLAHSMIRRQVVKQGSFVEGVAAGALLVEVSVPDRYRKLATALIDHYGLKKSDLEFLYIHAGDPEVEGDYGGDAEHIREGMDIVQKYATTQAVQASVRLAVWKVLKARQTYQWGLFRHCYLRYQPAFQELCKGDY